MACIHRCCIHCFLTQTIREEHMAIQSILKSTVVAMAIVAGGTAFAQGTPINAAAFDALVAQGPVADAATVASNAWASKIKKAGKLRLGTTQTSNLFSLLNEKDGKIRGFDSGVAELLTRYILGDGSKYQFAQVTSSTREQILINNQVDMVIATYSITPARAEKISFAGPYFIAGQDLLVRADDNSITGPDSLKYLGDAQAAFQSYKQMAKTPSTRPPFTTYEVAMTTVQAALDLAIEAARLDSPHQ